MDYSKLSDAEINAAVAKRFPDRFMFNDEGSPYSLEPDSMAAYSGSDFDEVEFDPCNNAADAWPIILANRIALMPDESEHGAPMVGRSIQLSDAWNSVSSQPTPVRDDRIPDDARR